MRIGITQRVITIDEIDETGQIAKLKKRSTVRVLVTPPSNHDHPEKPFFGLVMVGTGWPELGRN